MKKLILIRYGEWHDQHLSEEDKRSMLSTAERLKYYLQKQTFCVVSANVPRATESAEVIAKFLNAPSVKNFTELYVAEENNQLPDPTMAMKILNTVGESYDTVIAVISREYTETLPEYISVNIFNFLNIPKIKLKRGEALIVDFETKSISCLN